MGAGIRVRLIRSIAGVGIVSAIAGTSWLILLGKSGVLFDHWVIHNAVVAVGLGIIAWLVVASQPRNGTVLVSAWTAFFTGLYCLADGIVYALLDAAGITRDLSLLSPSDLPTHIAIFAMQTAWLYLPLFLAMTVAWLLFPDGRVLSPRWRWAVWASVGFTALGAAGLAWSFRPSATIPYAIATSTEGTFRDLGIFVAVSQYGGLAMILVSVTALIARFRLATGIERQQFRWVVWGASLLGLTMVPVMVYSAITRLDSARWPFLIGLIALVFSYGVAIGKYRLYDVDVVISRTFVYGSLGVFITVVYVGIVVGVGYLVGLNDEPSQALGILATVIIAIAFQPLRRGLQRVANRMVFGKRATPYQVLSEFSQRVAAVDPEVLGQIARSLAEGTTASAASVWVVRGQELYRVAMWPEDQGGPDHVGRNGSIPGADQLAEVTHDGDHLGTIALAVAPGQPFPPTDARLLEQVASGMGLALRNLRLTEDLRARVEQLRDSRRRIVGVQDQTRRQLERDLHDGAQQRLVALKIKLGLGASIAEKAGLEDVSGLLTTLKDETDHTIESVRDFARGIYPPLLEAEGLPAALTGQSRKITLPVTVHAVGIGRYPRDLEAAVYFCVLEALQNAVKHSRAGSIMVSLDEVDGELRFEVRDDGVGFDREATGPGGGLLNMSDRLDSVGGSLEVTSALGRGTLLVGRIPIAELVSR